MGAITGTYLIGSYPNVVFHAFLRDPNGTFTIIDPPGSVGAEISSSYLGSQPINPAGAITGDYFDASGANHGFLRAKDGTITTFDPPGSTGTFVGGINPSGAITGNYCTANSCDSFVRTRDGAMIAPLDVPDSNGTFASVINPTGAITGYYFDANFVIHGFVRIP
jgi:hypothetical protein